MKWISVKEELPKPGLYLCYENHDCYGNFHVYQYLGKVLNGEGTWYSEEYGKVFPDFWMILPEAPK